MADAACPLDGCAGLSEEGTCPNGYAETCEAIKPEPTNMADDPLRQASAASRPPILNKERRFVAVARYNYCACKFGEPTTYENAQRDAQAFRDEINDIGVGRRIAVYELRLAR